MPENAVKSIVTVRLRTCDHARGDGSIGVTKSIEGETEMIHNITTARRIPNRRVTLFTKVITAMILAPFLIAAFVGVGLGVAKSIHTTSATPAATSSSTVTTYNDGWVDAKRDDCEQGFQAACKWLDQQHISH